MTDNPIKPKAQAPKKSVQEWIDRGNAYLWGKAPAEHGKEAGTYIKTPRFDLEWAEKDGHYFIRPRI